MTLKEYLQGLTKEELVALVMELGKKHKEVKGYFELTLNPGGSSGTKQAEEAKKKIHRLLNIRSGPKVADAKKIISEFKKLSPPADLVIDVMLSYVESGIAFIDTYGSTTQSFYSSGATVFRDACLLIRNNEMESIFMERVKKLRKVSSGYGLESDFFGEIFGTQFNG